VDRLFADQPARFEKPHSVSELEAAAPALAEELHGTTGEVRRTKLRDLRERERAALEDLSLAWLHFARDPANAATAKWTLFLSDVYVVSAEKVRNAALIYDHFDIIARHSLGPAPRLTKAISRSPAMVMYLDLNQSRRTAPNENFARELLELFVLGEGNYSEADIKQAARAFTGYRAQPRRGEFMFQRRQHDAGPKTIFGVTGPFGGDDVIDLAYRQPAARTFLPHEMMKFYLCDSPLPTEYLVGLGASWQAAAFDLRWLVRRFFTSRLFFATAFRGNFIKSPVQFYLGLLGDLGLEVAPLHRMSLNPLRQMGQWLFYPPNVRGWVGGPHWMNSATLTARRQLVEMLFSPIHEQTLNADEQRALNDARAHATKPFVVDDAQFMDLVGPAPRIVAEQLTTRFLAGDGSGHVVSDLASFLSHATGAPKFAVRRIARAAAALLQSPQYQVT